MVDEGLRSTYAARVDGSKTFYGHDMDVARQGRESEVEWGRCYLKLHVGRLGDCACMAHGDVRTYHISTWCYTTKTILAKLEGDEMICYF
jgi:hypothetical protein